MEGQPPAARGRLPGLAGLRSFYRTGELIELAELPEGTARLLVHRATGQVMEARAAGTHSPGPTGGPVPVEGLEPGTYSVEALGRDGQTLAEDLTTVASHPGERPVHAFATSFLPTSVPTVLEWLRALRCTVVQAYDWMEQYSAPLGAPEGWKDPSGREISFAALRALAAGIRSLGAVAHAYAPVYAIDRAFSAQHPEWLMYRGDGQPEYLFDNIVLADPGNAEWQEHFAYTYGSAADAIGFNGFHLDTYGYPRAALDHGGLAVDARQAYGSFLARFRGQRPTDLISFNQVNGVPSALTLPGGPGFRYCEVWRPNDLWRHLEGLLDRSSGRAGRLGPALSPGADDRGTIACYPPVWGAPEQDGPLSPGARLDAVRTVVLTEAIATSLGSAALLYGDEQAVLCDPYYPQHQRLSAREAATALDWHWFALRCRDLFTDGEDTSWYDISDENGAVAVECEVPCLPEPMGGSVLARVSRTDSWVAISLVDLTGSPKGSWSDRSARGTCPTARVKVLLDRPDSWQGAIAAIGRHGGHFVPADFTVVAHREGLAAMAEVPLAGGWAVLRLTIR